MATVITIASHVEAFNGSQYKRSLSSSSTPSVPAKRLSRPNSELTPPAQFPATTARPDQRVNVRVPVSRACYSRLLPGQVAFVNRQFGKFHPSAKLGLGGLTPVASMEEVNDMLAQEHNFLSTTASTASLTKDFLFKEVETSSVYNHDGKNRKKATAMVFKDVDIDAQHPVMQFALDGLVATRVEEVDDLNTYSSASAQQACIVAVKGPAPMRLAPVPRETHTGMRESMMGTRIPAENVFLEPARILAKVYVALVAVFVDVKDTNRRFKLRYEVVSSSNLDVDRVFATGRKLFRDELHTLEDDELLAAGNRIVLRVSELGSVVDTAFGPAEQPQLTVCVHVAPLERVTITDNRHSPVAPYALFAKMTRVELRKNRQDRLGVTGPSRLYRTDPTGKLSVLGARPFITGAPSDADFQKLSRAVIAMQTTMQSFVSTLLENSANLHLIKNLILGHVRSPELEQEPHQEDSGAGFFEGIESLEHLKSILADVLRGGDGERDVELAALGKHIIEFYKQQNAEPYTDFDALAADI